MAKQSLLTDSHQRKGAAFIEQNGWQLADHFGDVAAEYETVRKRAGLFDLSHRALLRFTGSDRVSFLQGMLSNDVRLLKMFDGQQAAILTQQGKVIADVRVLCAMNSLYLDFWEFLKDKILGHLHRYLVADDVEILDSNEQWKFLSLQGPGAPNLLGEVFTDTPLPTEPNQHGMVQFDGAPICLVRADHSGHNGFDLIVQNAQLMGVANRVTDLGAGWVGERAQNILRVEAGMPRYGVDFSEDNLLLEVGLEDSYSYSKGCYLGQEVVERIRSRGHVNRKLCGLMLDGDRTAAASDAILAGDHEIGIITSSVISFELNRPIALGYVYKDFWSPGTKVTVRREGDAITAVVSPLPFSRASAPS